MPRRSWKRAFPGCAIAGTRNGYFATTKTPRSRRRNSRERREAAVRRAGLAAPRVLARRAPARDGLRRGYRRRRIVRRDRRPGRRARRASVRRLGLEWLYRLVKEPHRWRRQLALPRFVWLVALDGLGFVAQERRGELVKAMILAGGLSTRLYPLTKQVPKPLVPVAGVPNAVHLIRYLQVVRLRRDRDQRALSRRCDRRRARRRIAFGVKLHYLHEPELHGQRRRA